MKHYTLLVTFIFALQIATAQKAPVKFGDVPIEDVKMTSYEGDSSASAIVLTDFGESSIVFNQTAGFTIEFERIKRIKILSRDGYDYANFSVPIYKSGSEDEKLSALKAVTYNLEGDKVVETKMKNESVFTENIDDNLALVKFTMPNVKVGSVLEVSYKVFSPFLFNFQDWDFQTTIPVRWSEYRARIPEYFDYKTYQQGYISWPVQEHVTQSKTILLTHRERVGNSRGLVSSSVETENVDYVEHYYRWAVGDVPAFREEPYMTTYRNFISQVNFELAFVRMPRQPVKSYSSSWEEIAKNLLEADNFGGAIKGTSFAKDLVAPLIKDKTTEAEKVSAIYHYLKQAVAWDGQSRKYPTRSLRKVFDEKKGNSAEINLLLVAMLQKAGISASAFLISTRDHGFIHMESPASQQFNYVLAYLEMDGKYVLLDATERTLPISALPDRCLNGQGLIISEKSGWAQIKATSKSRLVASGDLQLTGDGELKGKVEFTRDGYEAQRARVRFIQDGEKEYPNQVASEHGFDVKSVSIANMKEIDQPVKESFDVEFTDYLQSAGEMIYLNPIVSLRWDENPFHLASRLYPVDFGSQLERLLTLKITLDEKLTVEELPQPKAIILPNKGGRFNYSITQAGNMLMVTNHFILNQTLFTQEEYAALREFYAQVVAKQAEQIVIKRK